MHLYDDIGDASSSFRGTSSSLIEYYVSYARLSVWLFCSVHVKISWPYLITLVVLSNKINRGRPIAF